MKSEPCATFIAAIIKSVIGEKYGSVDQAQRGKELRIGGVMKWLRCAYFQEFDFINVFRAKIVVSYTKRDDFCLFLYIENKLSSLIHLKGQKVSLYDY